MNTPCATIHPSVNGQTLALAMDLISDELDKLHCLGDRVSESPQGSHWKQWLFCWKKHCLFLVSFGVH